MSGMAKISLDDLLDVGERHARKILLQRREPMLQTFFHLVAPEGEKDAIIPCNWRDDYEKDVTVATVKATAAIMKAVMALYVSEAWMLTLPPPLTSWHAQHQMDNTPRPSESPDRVEVVHIMAYDGITAKGRTLQMVRNRPGGKLISLVLIPEADTENTGYVGRMIDGIIPPRKEAA